MLGPFIPKELLDLAGKLDESITLMQQIVVELKEIKTILKEQD